MPALCTHSFCIAGRRCPWCGAESPPVRVWLELGVYPKSPWLSQEEPCTRWENCLPVAGPWRWEPPHHPACTLRVEKPELGAVPWKQVLRVPLILGGSHAVLSSRPTEAPRIDSIGFFIEPDK